MIEPNAIFSPPPGFAGDQPPTVCGSNAGSTQLTGRLDRIVPIRSPGFGLQTMPAPVGADGQSSPADGLQGMLVGIVGQLAGLIGQLGAALQAFMGASIPERYAAGEGSPAANPYDPFSAFGAADRSTAPAAPPTQLAP
ncbi:MAG: hypothetical protein ACREM6_00395 [Vulcanimicrobiaceae bacterium]